MSQQKASCQEYIGEKWQYIYSMSPVTIIQGLDAELWPAVGTTQRWAKVTAFLRIPGYRPKHTILSAEQEGKEQVASVESLFAPSQGTVLLKGTGVKCCHQGKLGRQTVGGMKNKEALGGSMLFHLWVPSVARGHLTPHTRAPGLRIWC